MTNSIVKLKDIKIIFLDIDGTLTDNKKTISNYTKEIIKKAKEKGIYVILCSGRVNSYTIEKSKLTTASSIVISNNGTLIYDYEKDKTIFESPFPKELIEKIYNYSIENQVDCTLNTIYNRYKSSKSERNNYITDATIIDSFNEINENITQGVINSYDYQKIMKVKDYLSAYDKVVISNTNIYYEKKDPQYAWFMDINMINNSKGKAINKLLEYLNINKDQTICFGDQMNDYPMFEACKYSVAMKNGNDELKKKATFITELTNDEDGVAHFIKKYIIKGE